MIIAMIVIIMMVLNKILEVFFFEIKKRANKNGRKVFKSIANLLWKACRKGVSDIITGML
jgi:K+-transporting ATPase A subunit